MTGLAFEMWLVVLALYKAWERSRAGAVVEKALVAPLRALGTDFLSMVAAVRDETTGRIWR